MARPYEFDRAEPADKGNAIVTPRDETIGSGREKFDCVDSRDELATDHDLFQIITAANGFVIEKTEPKICIFHVH